MRMDTLVRGNTTAKTRNPYVTTDPAYRRFKRPAADLHCQPGSPEAAVKNWTINGVTAPTHRHSPGREAILAPGQRGFGHVSRRTGRQHAVADRRARRRAARDADDREPLRHSAGEPRRIHRDGAALERDRLPPHRVFRFRSGRPGDARDDARRNRPEQFAERLCAPSRANRSPRPRTSGRARTARIRPRVHQAHAIARTQTLTYSDQNTINGQSYNPSGPPQFYAQSGTMEQWQIVNNSGQVHTFHIHQVHFLVQAIVGGTPIEQQNVNQVMDNVNVPCGDGQRPRQRDARARFHGSDGPRNVSLALPYPLARGRGHDGENPDRYRAADDDERAVRRPHLLIADRTRADLHGLGRKAAV